MEIRETSKIEKPLSLRIREFSRNEKSQKIIERKIQIWEEHTLRYENFEFTHFQEHSNNSQKLRQ